MMMMMMDFLVISRRFATIPVTKGKLRNCHHAQCSVGAAFLGIAKQFAF
jgi:hypothetical protein